MVSAIGCKDRSSRSARSEGPDFTLRDLSGNDVSLEDFRGKVVLLEFWATWCPPCRAAVPELIALHKQMQGRDFALIAVSMDENRDKVKDFVDEQGIPYLVLIDDAGISSQYGVFSIPTSFIIDRNGKVISKHAGYGEGMIAGISKEIESLMAMSTGAAPAEQPQAEQPQAEQMETGQPQAEQMETGQPQAEQMETGQPQAEQMETGQPQAEQMETGQPQTAEQETSQQ
jgi:peroxiredoxin